MKVKTTVAGPARTIQWKVPSSISAKANSFLGDFTASCAAANPNLVLISTTVTNPNQAPTATDQTVPVAFNTPTGVTLSGTDPDANPLTFAATSTPAHGVISGTAPNLTYTPTTGYSGPDSFTFTASDGTLSDTGTVSLNVSAAPTTVPGSPIIGSVQATGEGAATVTLDRPDQRRWRGDHRVRGDAGRGRTPGTPSMSWSATTLARRSPTSTNGTAHTFQVAAINGVGTGPAATSAAVTPQWWLPWTSGPVAVNELFTWMTGEATDHRREDALARPARRRDQASR